MKVVHSWLKEYVGDKLPDAAKVEDLLNFHAFEVDGVERVEGEDVLDVDILPNRASDCLCHRGIARELATILDTELKEDPLRTSPDLSGTEVIKVDIEDKSVCPRFTAALIEGIEVKDSPDWLQKRLKAIGQRPINNIVDATNYVMYAIGQPLHAYDADLFKQVEGKWNFVVRKAKSNETVSLLAEGGKNEDRIVELNGSELLIVDGSTDTPIGLAGVKGGRYAGVHEGTKNIIIEAAHFEPISTRKTARRLGIVIDASKRFENEPSRELPIYAQRDICALITDIAGGKCEGVLDEYLVPQEKTAVTVTVAKTNALLGLTLSATEIESIITRTGSDISEKNDDYFIVTGPWERTDLLIEEDFIEEVGRIHGLSHIESVIPAAIKVSKVNKNQYYSEKIRRSLLEVGFSEVITTSFQKKGKLKLRNALASDKGYMRASLAKNITSVLDTNFVHTDLLGVQDIRVFEIGTVFEKTDSSIIEHTSLCIGARVKGSGYTPKDDKVLEVGCIAVKEVLSGEVDWQIEKGVAELNLTSLLGSLPQPDAYEPFSSQQAAVYKPVSAYPAVARDIALWVGEGHSSETVISVLTESAGDLCVRQTLFDTFTKDDRTSYAFRLVFQSTNRTLTDVEVNSVMDNINAVAKQAGWEVR